MPSDIIGFCEDRSANLIGMIIDGIAKMEHEKMESNHHYIQWAFPETIV